MNNLAKSKCRTILFAEVAACCAGEDCAPAAACIFRTHSISEQLRMKSLDIHRRENGLSELNEMSSSK